MQSSRQVINFEGKYLNLISRYYSVNNRETAWEFVARNNVYHSGAVVIVALTSDGELILEKNWRIPIESYVIQFPAGLTDREGESEEEAARRELLEETGYLANKLIPIVTTPECSVLTPTRVRHFLATDVKYVGDERRDDLENIEVLKLPIHNLSSFLLNLPPDTMLELRVPGIIWILEKQGLLIYETKPKGGKK
jgi:8-oxo-dGTP pyrophosphatase MutT (NUDIX family)